MREKVHRCLFVCLFLFFVVFVVICGGNCGLLILCVRFGSYLSQIKCNAILIDCYIMYVCASRSHHIVSAKLTTKQMKQLERRGQWAQQQIIDIDR